MGKEDQSYWERLIEEQTGSGLTIAKFCEERQIKFSAFKNKKYQLTKERAKNPNIVPLRIIDKPEIVAESKNCQGFEISVIFRNGHRVVVPGQLLSSILYEIAKLPC